jgi:hypothetical protein
MALECFGPDHGEQQVDQGGHGQDCGQVEHHETSGDGVVSSDVIAGNDQREEQAEKEHPESKGTDGHHGLTLSLGKAGSWPRAGWTAASRYFSPWNFMRWSFAGSYPGLIRSAAW